MIEQKPRRPLGRRERGEDTLHEPPPAGPLARGYGSLVVWLAPLLVVVVAAAAYGSYRYLPSIASAGASSCTCRRRTSAPCDSAALAASWAISWTLPVAE